MRPERRSKDAPVEDDTERCEECLICRMTWTPPLPWEDEELDWSFLQIFRK